MLRDVQTDFALNSCEAPLWFERCFIDPVKESFFAVELSDLDSLRDISGQKKYRFPPHCNTRDEVRGSYNLYSSG